MARAILWLLAWCPARPRRALAGLLARAATGRGRLSGKFKVDRVAANLNEAFPDQDEPARASMVRANARALAETALECAPLWHRSQVWIMRRIARVERRELVEAPLRAGRGVLVLGGHLGQWELSILYGSLTLPIAYLYKPPRDPALDRLLTAFRARFEVEMIASDGVGLRRALRQLRGGGALGLLFDQLPKRGHWVEAPFFGRPAPTMTLPHRLIQASGCAVVMGHCLRLEHGRGWKVVFDPVPGADTADPVAAATAMNQALETAIRRCPEQYLWHYPRFAWPARA